MGEHAGVGGGHERASEPRDTWRSVVPVMLLLAVAATQVFLSQTAALSPWKGGGFGMFASTDGSAFRRVRIFVEADGRSEEIDLPASLEPAATRTSLFPSERRLRALADAVATRERRHDRPVTSVTVQVWATRFEDAPLQATEVQVRSLVHDVH